MTPRAGRCSTSSSASSWLSPSTSSSGTRPSRVTDGSSSCTPPRYLRPPRAGTSLSPSHRSTPTSTATPARWPSTLYSPRSPLTRHRAS
ncbi:hypothetical protein [Ornithinimicrobium kibberense]|uniref:hypothetical protein n=1 Tax=Ornithinimicrobium kibberense TaxID=282060 RepID=UPI0036218476